MVSTRKTLFIYPSRRPDLDGLISCYSPILEGRFIFVVHLFTEGTAFAGALSVEGLHSSSWFLQAQGFVSSSCIAIKAQVSHNSLALCLYSVFDCRDFPPPSSVRHAIYILLFYLKNIKVSTVVVYLHHGSSGQKGIFNFNNE